MTKHNNVLSNGTLTYLKKIAIIVTLCLTVAGLGSGWGLYAQALTTEMQERKKIDIRVESNDCRLTEIEKSYMRIDERTINIKEQLDRIEKKLNN